MIETGQEREDIERGRKGEGKKIRDKQTDRYSKNDRRKSIKLAVV